MRRMMLDTGPLGRIVHPRRNRDLVEWLQEILAVGVILPEISDYELRRNLLLESFEPSIQRLDRLSTLFTYQPISTSTMRKAAKLWASARRSGQPTADQHALDGDMILAAQALESGSIVITENVGHLSRFVEAKRWHEIAL
ncbi:MAG: PIN domain-containing protein [Candidatus Poribacteria bacterium]|nr:PIN domain-containing protein [Candidatus Poribacteria bacterium]